MIEVRAMRVTDLIPYVNNARQHSDEQVAQIAASIREFGFNNPILCDGQKGVIAGHGRLLAARKMGLEMVPAIELAHLTETQKKAYILADNRIAENATWDEALVRIELEALDAEGFDTFLTGFDLLVEERTEGLTCPEEVPDIPEQPVSAPGDIWVMDSHRLLCGDSTSVSDLERLCAGQMVDMWLTDPPYNVAYEGKTKDALKIKNDAMADGDFLRFLCDAYTAADAVMKPGAVFYIWHADSESYNFRGAARAAGWTVRQCLIWKKQTMVMGRQDYHWKHEPCQPAGTMVRVPGGWKAIEELKDGDRIVGFDTYSGSLKGLRDGIEIQTASRDYDGEMYEISCGGFSTKATDNHHFSIRFNPSPTNRYCTYLMQRGDRFRIGRTITYDARQFGLKTRFHQERADRAWIIDTFPTAIEAQMGEQLLAAKYGIPYTHWEPEKKYCTTNPNARTKEMIDWLYSRLDAKEQNERARRLLVDHGRNYDYPLLDGESIRAKFSRRVTAKINACNLIPGVMQLPVALDKYVQNSTFEWKEINRVSCERFSGRVYSLSVPKWEHYVADGIITHNCLYGWKEGAGHLWASDRKQTTILEFDRPSRNAEHPTMKPVALFEYQLLNNTKGGDIVLDSFGGSGTTLIAAEKNGRTARIVELDPKYCDVIVNRWQNFTGGRATLEATGQTFSEVASGRT
nr:DNA methyltransferase [Desulfuromonas thiophila]